MPTHDADSARILNRIADRLEINGANPLRVRAYRNAARTVRDSSGDFGVSGRGAAGRACPQPRRLNADTHKGRNEPAGSTARGAGDFREAARLPQEPVRKEAER